MLYEQTTLNCNGTLVDLQYPIVMGILNITPDSFYDGGRYKLEKEILAQIEKLIAEGAKIIDIGGMSSRPGAELISTDEELKRVLPVITSIQKRFPETILSIDTFRSEVAVKSIEAGASIINDISAGRLDDTLFETIAKYKIPYILMHMLGTPQTMQKQPEYNQLVVEVMDFFIEKIEKLRVLKIKDIILDVGFGFGKTMDHNYELLKNLHTFRILELPILAGVSRKSMICKVLKVNPKAALNGTTALHMAALLQGAKILRAHDVKEAVETIELWKVLDRQPLI